MNDDSGDDRILLGLAVAAAFAAGLVAVEQHCSCTAAGYQLAVASRENLELRRACDEAERHVSRLRTPQAALARLAPMKLPKLDYPKRWNIVSSRTLLAASSGPAPLAAVPAAGGAR